MDLIKKSTMISTAGPKLNANIVIRLSPQALLQSWQIQPHIEHNIAKWLFCSALLFSVTPYLGLSTQENQTTSPPTHPLIDLTVVTLASGYHLPPSFNGPDPSFYFCLPVTAAN